MTPPCENDCENFTPKYLDSGCEICDGDPISTSNTLFKIILETEKTVDEFGFEIEEKKILCCVHTSEYVGDHPEKIKKIIKLGEYTGKDRKD